MAEAVDTRRRAPAADIDEILRLHREWWEANVGIVIPRMVKVFPSPGDEYLMFNLNGHPYFGMGEKVALWKWYGERIEQTRFETRIMRLEVRGDTAWLACEATLDASQRDSDEWTVDSGDDSPYVRATEIYHRDDGMGRPEWRMWHVHASPLPQPDETRPGFDDSISSRGLGWTPWEPLPERA